MLKAVVGTKVRFVGEEASTGTGFSSLRFSKQTQSHRKWMAQTEEASAQSPGQW